MQYRVVIWLTSPPQLLTWFMDVAQRSQCKPNVMLLMRQACFTISRWFFHSWISLTSNYFFQLILLACVTTSWVFGDITHELPRRSKGYGHHYGPYGPTPKPYTPYPSPTVLYTQSQIVQYSATCVQFERNSIVMPKDYEIVTVMRKLNIWKTNIM